MLYDDRAGKVSPGVKFKDAELIGVPTIVVVGKGLADGVIEVKDRATGEREQVAADHVVDHVVAPRPRLSDGRRVPRITCPRWPRGHDRRGGRGAGPARRLGRDQRLHRCRPPQGGPGRLARRIEAAHARGEEFRIGLWSGASTAPEVDGLLASVHGVDRRLPYNSDPTLRARSTTARSTTSTPT